MEKQSIFSTSSYIYDCFFRHFRKTVRRIGLKLWLVELFFEVYYLLRYPKFKYLYKIYPSELGVEGHLWSVSNQYEAINYHTLVKCFQRLSLFEKAFDQSLFIDIGSGMGRVLHQAYISGFRNLLGIELSLQLCALCKQNLEKHIPSHYEHWEIVNEDVVNLEFKSVIPKFLQSEQVKTVVFCLYNPFTEEVLERFVNNLHDLASYRLYIVYVGKQYKDTLLKNGFSIIHEETKKGQFILDSFRIYFKANSSL